MRRLLPVSIAIAFLGVLGACSATGGSYEPSGRRGGNVDRGETNGRRFDFVSNKPEQDDWQIRVTGNSMWVSYARAEKADKLGSFILTDQETNKLWRLIDALDIPNRKRGKRDEDEGYVSLQLKEPGDDRDDLHHIYISRATENADLIALARYLQDLTEKYKKRRPNF